MNRFRHNKASKKDKRLHIYKTKKIKQRDLLGPFAFSSNSCDYVLTNQKEIDILSQYILDYPNIETGGQLFGYWTYDGKPVVLFVLGPGPKSGHYDTFFMQDIDYLKRCSSTLKRLYGLDHVGEWHSHHQLGLSHPSGYDSRNISSNMRALGYKKFLLCIATCTSSESSINAFMFDSCKNEYEQIPWVIKDTDSPYRKIIKEDYFILPRTKYPNMVNLFCKSDLINKSKIDYDNTYWLIQKGNSKILKSIIDTLKGKFPSHDFIPTIDNSNEVHVEIYQDGLILEDIHFPMGFPTNPPNVIDSHGHDPYIHNKWIFNGDILSSFFSYYKNPNKY